MNWTRQIRARRRRSSTSPSAVTSARSRRRSAYERRHPSTTYDCDAYSDMDLAGNPPGFGPPIEDVEDLTILAGLERADDESKP